MSDQLSITPAGVELYISDLPDYYAAGDRDLVIVYRRSAIGEDETPHDREVGAYLSGGSYQLGVWRENGEAGEDRIVFRLYASTGTELTEEQIHARHKELEAPLEAASNRIGKRWARFVLTGRDR